MVIRSKLVEFNDRKYNLCLVIFLTFVSSQETSTVYPCNTVSDCFASNITGELLCEGEKCVCADNYTFVEAHNSCLPILKLGEDCEHNRQCQEEDAHTECMYASNAETPHKICRCAFGHEKEYSNGQVKCIRMYRTVLFEKDVKKLHFFGNGDNMAIILSCLAALLAFLACFAGIFQFVRKKRNSHRSLHCEDPQNPQEVVTLNGSTPSQMPPASEDVTPTGLFNSADFTPIDKTPSSLSPHPSEGKIGRSDRSASYDKVYKRLERETEARKEEESDDWKGDVKKSPRGSPTEEQQPKVQ